MARSRRSGFSNMPAMTLQKYPALLRAAGNRWACRAAAVLGLATVASSCCGDRGTSGPAFPPPALEAESGRTNAKVLPPSNAPGTPESESSGRSHVVLSAAGHFVEFQMPGPANALVIRYGLPDAPHGGGRNATISLLVNGRFVRKIPLASTLSHVYGDYPWTNNPAGEKARLFFDEVQVRMEGVHRGDVIRLEKRENDTAEFYRIDFVEAELAPPALARPRNSLSLEEFGAIPNDGLDDSSAFVACLAAASASRRILWIPAGEFRLDGERIPIGDVVIRGAGMWHSKLTGLRPMFEGNGRPLHMSDLAIFGGVDHRDNEAPDNAFNGNFGDGTTLKNLWIEHVKCGVWTLRGTKNMRIENCRIRNTMADGVNFCDGTEYSTVRNCHIRYTGDDALATWSPSGDWSSKKPCVGNRFLNNRIQFPWLANGIGIYGGRDHAAMGNTVQGTVLSGGGLLISSGHGAIPFSGTIRATDNTFLKTGGECYIGAQVGAIWVHAAESDIDVPVIIEQTRILDSSGAGISVHGPRRIADLRLAEATIHGADGPAIRIYPDARGAIRISALTALDTEKPIIQNASEKFKMRMIK